MKALAGWRRRARALRAETFALYLACRDPRVLWYARALAVAVVAYAFSPIDLIPDSVLLHFPQQPRMMVRVGTGSRARTGQGSVALWAARPRLGRPQDWRWGIGRHQER